MLNSSNLQAKLSGVNLSQVLGARELFSNLMLDLQTGEILLVRGANGCGKTSLLRIICGLALPESGTVFWDNKNIHELPHQLGIFSRGHFLENKLYRRYAEWQD